MNLIELKNRLYWGNVPDSWYSLNEGLKPDALIIFENYSEWEFFYLGEKGGRNEYQVFNKAEDAYDHLWEMIAHQLNVFKIAPREGQR